MSLAAFTLPSSSVPVALSHGSPSVASRPDVQPQLSAKASAAAGAAASKGATLLAATPGVVLAAAAAERCLRQRRRWKTSRQATGRRNVVAAPWLAGAAAAALRPESAKAETEAQERQFALNMKNNVFAGDVFFPDWIEGDWVTVSELTTVEMPQGNAAAGKAAIEKKNKAGKATGLEKYVQRWIPYNGNIIADRSMNSQLIRCAYGDDAKAKAYIDWKPEEASVVNLQLTNNGIISDLKINNVLRAAFATDGRKDLFNTSELFFKSIPSSDEVVPLRVVNKYKYIDNMSGGLREKSDFANNNEEVQVIQRLEVYKPMANATDTSADFGTPVAIYKYRTRMVPKPEAAQKGK
eukprot:TRINITY_DN3135_c0_g1_i1.p1 TRINITY_DN3135_c0_g1~~TRINITY_DN3135_c0_g1_i1.p1  ORF type:complete len:352 (-),score=102.85 TRINITY_DN3135_c0_g1_i1:142-1197(-)